MSLAVSWTADKENMVEHSLTGVVDQPAGGCLKMTKTTLDFKVV